jgi:hypothetical protein
MSTGNICDTYFDDTLRIYAICAEDDLPDSFAKLFSYIHVRARESSVGLRYFDTPDPEAVRAISILLGEEAADLPDIPEQHAEFMASVGNAISAIDARSAANQGIETPLASELRLRLRLYKDEAFRKMMIAEYRKRIAQAESCDWDRVRRAFREYREKKARQEESDWMGEK